MSSNSSELSLWIHALQDSNRLPSANRWRRTRVNVAPLLSPIKRAVQLRAEAHGAKTEAERECLEAVYAYEEVLSANKGRRQPASRTWQMIRRHGVLPAVERIVTKRAESAGYTALAEMGLLDMAFEAVVLRHPDLFSTEAIAMSRERIESRNG